VGKRLDDPSASARRYVGVHQIRDHRVDLDSSRLGEPAGIWDADLRLIDRRCAMALEHKMSRIAPLALGQTQHGSRRDMPGHFSQETVRRFA